MRTDVLCLLSAWLAGMALAMGGGSCPPSASFTAETYLDAGRQVGAHFKDMIQARYNKSSLLRNVLLPYANTPAGAAAIDILVNASAARYPDYADENRGIAEGAGIPVYHALLMNLRDEIAFMAPAGGRAKMSKSCSDYSLMTETGDQLVAHNEDGGGDDVGFVYVLTVAVGSNPPFTAYTYAGELPTAAFGWNTFFGFTLNSLHPSTVLSGKGGRGTVGRNFVSRSVLDARSLEEAVQRGTVRAQHHAAPALLRLLLQAATPLALLLRQSRHNRCTTTH
jgi:hypothetical protein